MSRHARKLEQQVELENQSSNAVFAINARSESGVTQVPVETVAIQSAEQQQLFSAHEPVVRQSSEHAFLDVVLRPSSSGGPNADAEGDILVNKHRHAREPVSDPIEIALFEYYVRETGWWLDIVSPDCHFSRTVAKLAMEDHLLYSACLAYSSHVLHLLGRVSRSTEQHYAGIALNQLIAKLNEDPHTWSETSVLSSTVLMRVSEQFSEIGDDQQYHLNGAFSVSAAGGRTWSIDNHDMATTAFFTYLRMTIRICFLCEQGTTCDMNLIREHEFDAWSTSEAGMCNRMTHLIAKTCNTCWAPAGGMIEKAELESRARELEDWKRALPATFDAWATYEDPEQPFWVVKYLSTWHAIAWQFYNAAKVVLAVHFALLSPPRSVLEQSQYLEREILKPTRELCAVAFSRPETGTDINAAALIAWCAQFLLDQRERSAVIEWLQNLMETSRWPNKTCTQRLQRIWAGQQSSWTADAQ
jgi:hypothetical protein